jgi:hypothetical protein
MTRARNHFPGSARAWHAPFGASPNVFSTPMVRGDGAANSTRGRVRSPEVGIAAIEKGIWITGFWLIGTSVAKFSPHRVTFQR